MEGIELKCSECKKLFDQNDINISKDTAYCTTCNKVYVLSLLTKTPIDLSHKQIAEAIEGILVKEDRSSLIIIADWNKLSNWRFGLTFGIFIVALTLPLTFVLPILGKLFTGLFTALGAWMIHQGYSHSVTKTFIELSNDCLTVYHTPKDLHPSIDVPFKSIKQLYVDRVDGGSNGSKKFWNHSLKMITTTETHTVISQIKLSTAAYKLERLIENKLNIIDSIIEEEYYPGKSDDQNSKLAAALLMKNVRQNKSEYGN